MKLLNHFKTKELLFISLMATALVVLNLLLAAGIIAATGIPLSSAFVTAITVGIFIVILIRIIPKPGALTLFFLIYSILEMPTTLGGAVGFWPKIPINVLSGIFGDLIMVFTKYRTWSLFPAFYAAAFVNISAFVFFLWLFGIPGVDKTVLIVHWLVLAYWILGTIGILIGIFIYKKIKNKKIVKQITA